MDRQKLKTLLAFGAIYIIWGSTYLGIRYAIEAIPPFLMMGTRSLTAGLILYFWSRLKGNGKLKRENLPPLFIIGTLFFLVGHGLLAWAQQHIPSGLAAVLVASEPLWVVAIESFFIRDARVRLLGIAGLILGFGGIVYLIVSTKGISSEGGDLIGSFAIVGGAFSWSIGAVYARVARLPKSAMLSAGMELIIGGSLLLITSFIIGEVNQFHITELSLRALLSLGYLIIFGSVITFSAYIWLLGHTSATRISTHTYVNPIIAILLGWLIADEQITAALVIAACIIIISVYLVLHDQYRKKKKFPLNN
jgi:drug/metabolite transporter (DMT)-like permease